MALMKSEGVEASRQPREFHAHDTSYSSANRQTIQVDMPSFVEDFDFESIRLYHDLAVSQTGGTNVGPNAYSASTWIREVRIKTKSGKRIGDNLTNYNAYAREMLEMLNSTDQDTSFDAVLEGADDTTPSGAYTTRELGHKLMGGLFDLKGYYPAHYHDGLRIEIDMEDAENVVRYDGSAPVYTVSNLRIVVDGVRLKQEVEAARLQQLQDTGIMVDYTNPQVVVNEVSTAQSQRKDLGTFSGRINSITRFTVKNTSRDASTEDYFGSFDYNNESSYRFKMGSKYLTDKEITVSSARQAEYLGEYLKAKGVQFGAKGLYGKASLTPAVLITTKFVIGQKVSRSKSMAVLSSIKDANNNKLFQEISYSSTPVAGTQYTVVMVDKRLGIFPGKQLRDLDFDGVSTPEAFQ